MIAEKCAIVKIDGTSSKSFAGECQLQLTFSMLKCAAKKEEEEEKYSEMSKKFKIFSNFKNTVKNCKKSKA
jgi:hypothetical protein